MRFYLTILLLIYRDLLVFHSKLRHILLGHWLKVIKKNWNKRLWSVYWRSFWQLNEIIILTREIWIQLCCYLTAHAYFIRFYMYFMPSFSEKLFGSSDESKKSWLMKIDFWYSILSLILILSVHICTERNSFLP